jgi:hypothetical protein
MLGWWLAIAAARADQCAAIPQATAGQAVKYLAPGAKWASFCEPCGDRAPEVHTITRSAAIVPTSTPALVQIRIDGQSVDLAYVFVKARPADPVWTNVAKLAKCPTTGVSRTIPSPGPSK